MKQKRNVSSSRWRFTVGSAGQSPPVVNPPMQLQTPYYGVLIPTFFSAPSRSNKAKMFRLQSRPVYLDLQWGNKMVIAYQPVLVLLSIALAIIGSLTSLAVTSGCHDAESESFERPFSPAMLINYNIVETILSIGIAIGVTAAGLFVVSNRRFGAFIIPGAGLLTGLGIASMHYLGMSAIRGCGLAYDSPLVAASVAIAVAACTAALWFHGKGERQVRQ
jgi:hypothetical protein